MKIWKHALSSVLLFVVLCGNTSLVLASKPPSQVFRYASIGWFDDSLVSNISDATLKSMIDHIKSVGYTGITFDYAVDVAKDGTVLDSVTQSRMLQLLDYSKQQGLSTALKIHWGFGDNQNIDSFTTPAGFNIDKFLQGVKQYFLKMAPTAQAHGVSMFVIGTESDNLVTAQYHDQWASIINTIRTSFDGIITYDGNYMGHSRDPFWQIGIWDLVDTIGLSFYPKFSTVPIYDINKIESLYFYRNAIEVGDQYGDTNTSIVNDIINLSRRYAKPISITEVMFENATTGINPGNTSINTASYLTPEDKNQQAVAIQALLEVIGKNLNGILDSWTIMGYDPWVYQNWDAAVPSGNFTADFFAKINAYKYRIELSNTPAEDIISQYLSKPIGYHTTNTTSGGPGNDIIYVSSGDNIIYTNGGADEIHCGHGSDKIIISSQQTKTFRIDVSAWFASTGSGPNTLTFKLNGITIGSATINSDPAKVLASPSGYWSDVQEFTYDLASISTINGIVVSNSNGVSQVNSLLINGTSIDTSTGSRNGTYTWGPKPEFVVGGDPTSFDVTAYYAAVAASNTKSITIDGGGGVNTVSFPENYSNYLITPQGDGTWLITSKDMAEKSATLQNVQHLVFSDTELVLVQLEKGWNLLGNSTSSSLNVATTFSDTSKISSVWKWIASKGRWAFYSPSLTSQALSDHAAGSGYDVLTTINQGEGFWVNAHSANVQQLPPGASIPVTAFQSTGSNALGSGWNLISTSDTATTSQLVTELGNNVSTIWAYDNPTGKWYFYAPSLAAQGGTVLTDYINAHGYLDFSAAGKSLGAGVGFWVNKP